QKIRERAVIPSSLISGKVLGEKFGFYREGALYERACAEIDPVALARGLMHAAIKRGVRVFTPVSAVEYDLTSRAASVLTDGGYEIEAKWLILANGYEMPPFVPASIHSVVSTWVFATAPNATSPWRDNTLVWEASIPYLYMRRTADGRIIVGGEDEKLLDPDRRDQLISAKCR